MFGPPCSNLALPSARRGHLMDEPRGLSISHAIGANSHGAVHSHARRGLAEGLAAPELEHVALLAVTTLGWPQAIKGLTWIRDVTQALSDE